MRKWCGTREHCEQEGELQVLGCSDAMWQWGILPRPAVLTVFTGEEVWGGVRDTALQLCRSGLQPRFLEGWGGTALSLRTGVRLWVSLIIGTRAYILILVTGRLWVPRVGSGTSEGISVHRTEETYMGAMGHYAGSCQRWRGGWADTQQAPLLWLLALLFSVMLRYWATQGLLLCSSSTEVRVLGHKVWGI